MIDRMSDDLERFDDVHGRVVRLTEERRIHIRAHPEMAGQWERLEETLAAPDFIVETVKDQTVHAYHRKYNQTPVTEKYLVVVVKYLEDDAFVLTAFFSSRLKRGSIIWQP